MRDREKESQRERERGGSERERKREGMKEREKITNICTMSFKGVGDHSIPQLFYRFP